MGSNLRFLRQRGRLTTTWYISNFCEFFFRLEPRNFFLRLLRLRMEFLSTIKAPEVRLKYPSRLTDNFGLGFFLKKPPLEEVLSSDSFGMEKENPESLLENNPVEAVVLLVEDKVLPTGGVLRF